MEISLTDKEIRLRAVNVNEEELEKIRALWEACIRLSMWERLDEALNLFYMSKATKYIEDRMQLNQYQQLAALTSGAGSENKEKQLITAALGLAGEAGEFANAVKKMTAHGHDFDEDILVEELGDCMWYIAEAATVLEIYLEAIGHANIEKLRKRYPDGFSEERSRNRCVKQ